METASKGSAIMLFVFFITSILNYVFNVSMAWLLSPAQFGMLGVALAIFSILALFIRHGFPSTVVKFLSEDVAIDDKKRTLKSTLLWNILTAFIVVIAVSISQILFFPATETYRLLFFVIFLIILLNSVLEIFRKALQGLFRFKEMGFTIIVESTTKLVFAFLFVYLGYGVLGALMGFVASSVFVILISIYFLRNFHFWKATGWSVTKCYTFAVPVFLGVSGITLIQSLDILAVKHLTGFDEQAGLYQATLVLARLPFFLTGALMVPLFPYISKHSNDCFVLYSGKAIKYVLLFIFPITLAISILPEEFIRLIFPVVYLPGAGALRVNALGMGVLSFVLVFMILFQAIGRPSIPVISIFLGVVVQSGLLLVFVPTYGIVGAASATLLGSLFSFILLARSYLRMNNLKIEHRMTIRLFLAFGISALFMMYFPTDTRLLTFVNIVLSSGVYLVFISLLGLLKGKDVEILSGALPKSEKSVKIKHAIICVIEKLNQTF